MDQKLMDKMSKQDLLHLSKISDVEYLKQVLEANVASKRERLVELAHKDDYEANVERSRLLGQIDLALNLLARI